MAYIISSQIYAAAQHHYHGLTCKGLPKSDRSGIVAIGPQLEAYKGHWWPLFGRMVEAASSRLFVFGCGEAGAS